MVLILEIWAHLIIHTSHLRAVFSDISDSKIVCISNRGTSNDVVAETYELTVTSLYSSYLITYYVTALSSFSLQRMHCTPSSAVAILPLTNDNDIATDPASCVNIPK